MNYMLAVLGVALLIAGLIIWKKNADAEKKIDEDPSEIEEEVPIVIASVPEYLNEEEQEIADKLKYLRTHVEVLESSYRVHTISWSRFKKEMEEVNQQINDIEWRLRLIKDGECENESSECDPAIEETAEGRPGEEL